MTQNNHQTSDLITPEEAEELNLNVFFWNTRKVAVGLTEEEQVRIEAKRALRDVYNKRAQMETKRLTRVTQWQPKVKQYEANND